MKFSLSMVYGGLCSESITSLHNRYNISHSKTSETLFGEFVENQTTMILKLLIMR